MPYPLGAVPYLPEVGLEGGGEQWVRPTGQNSPASCSRVIRKIINALHTRLTYLGQPRSNETSEVVIVVAVIKVCERKGNQSPLC